MHIADHSRRYLDQIGDLIGEAEEFYLGGFLDQHVSSYVSVIRVGGEQEKLGGSKLTSTTHPGTFSH